MLAVDPQWRIVYANRRVAGLREANAVTGDLVGRTLAETVPEVWQRMEAVLRLAAAEGAAYTIEEYFPGLDAWLEVRACPLPGGLCLWVREVNERIERQATLIESDNRLRSLVDNLPAAATYQLIRDPDGKRRFLYVSRGIERLNRVSAEAVLEDASVFYDQFLPEYRQIVEEAETESVRMMRPFHCEVPIRTPVGELRWFELVSSPRLLRDGRVVWDGLLVDVTARRHAEHALRRQSELATMLQEVATAANEASSVQDALRFGLQRVCRFLQWPLGSAWVRSETGELVSAGIYHGELSIRVAAFLPEVASAAAATSVDLPHEALANDRPSLVTNIAERTLPRYALAARAGFGTALYCPVPAAGETAALLEFFAEGEAEVDSTALAAVGNVATQLGRVFERVRAEEDRARHLEQERIARAEAERRALEEAALSKATGAVATARTQDDVIGEIARSAVTALCAEGAYVERIQPGTPEVVVAAVAGTRVPRVGARISFVGSLSETVLASGTPELVPDLTRAARPLPTGLMDGCRGCSGLAVPLAEGRAAIGALVLVRGPELPSFSSDEIERARIFSELAALAFGRVALIEESEAKRRELERVMESRARLIRGFSHDVKNPLGGADGYAQMLENGLKGALTAPQQET
ncbi:MAG: GAF domain-containing protein, partial [Longimicrobiales bacterium]